MINIFKNVKPVTSAILASFILVGCSTASKDNDMADISEVKEEVIGLEGAFGQFHFEVGRSELMGAKDGLLAISRMLHHHPNIIVQLNGHADASGADIENLRLSEKRVLTVVGALEGFGVNKSRIRTDFFGEGRPLCTNKTADGRACNRSVAVYFKER